MTGASIGHVCNATTCVCTMSAKLMLKSRFGPDVLFARTSKKSAVSTGQAESAELHNPYFSVTFPPACHLDLARRTTLLPFWFNS
jgi:hypothetical protein